MDTGEKTSVVFLIVVGIFMIAALGMIQTANTTEAKLEKAGCVKSKVMAVVIDKDKKPLPVWVCPEPEKDKK